MPISSRISSDAYIFLLELMELLALSPRIQLVKETQESRDSNIWLLMEELFIALFSDTNGQERPQSPLVL